MSTKIYMPLKAIDHILTPLISPEPFGDESSSRIKAKGERATRFFDNLCRVSVEISSHIKV